MAASLNVPQSLISRKSAISKSGVLTIHGFGVRVRMQSGHLEIEDGVGMDRRKIRLARVGHGLRRLVCISEDGFVTLSALCWLADVGASFVMIDRRGKVRFVTGPTAPSDARLRRAQALALGNGVGLKICRTLIDAKLKGQEQVVREQLKDAATADVIARFRSHDLPLAENFERIRTIEAHAAVLYFGALRNTLVFWPKTDLRRIPAHWRSVGSRQSPLSGGPRLAVTPVHAILNYCFALLESESRLALSALGLDPGLGLGLHTDTPNRDSLALDVLEPVRPQLESWLLNWIAREPLRRADFFETANGNCRLMSHFCSKLSQTARVWGKLVAPWAEYVARTLWADTSQSKSARPLPTRLTQARRREAKGATTSFPAIKVPQPDHSCCDCGVMIPLSASRCLKCSKATTRVNFRAGRKVAQRPDYLAKRAETMLEHRQRIRAWKPSASDISRDTYMSRVLPALARISKSEIQKALGVSEPYSSYIQRGTRIPHPRHWQALAQLVGVSPDA